MMTLAALATGLGGATLIPASAAAHGATEDPAAGTLHCRGDDASPMCAQAWNANPQAVCDWMKVNIGDTAGRHRELAPDGELCSAGRDKFAVFDEPGPWNAAALMPNVNGNYDVRFRATAPHATAYFLLVHRRPGLRSDDPAPRLGRPDPRARLGTEPAEAFPEFELDLGGQERPPHPLQGVVAPE
jgi:predicted carbohydrate-binding protein with CBM5 and CBM33 domain